MLTIDIITAGKIKSGPFYDLWVEYDKRLPWKTNLIEISVSSTTEEHQKIADKIDPRAHVYVLDEKGKPLKSIALAKQLNDLAGTGNNHVQFIIGGADGLSADIRKRANYLLSFGVQTWPHKLVRVMLIEQLYRASQIIAGHPYHRES